MSAPVTLSKVAATLKRFLPSFFAGRLLLEAQSLAVALARANDYVEALYVELFPDTATLTSIDRWEATRRIPVRVSDSLATRRARVLAKLRRIYGPDLARLDVLLYPLLDVAAGTVVFQETMRATIEAGLTLTTGVIATALPASVRLGAWFPGNIDQSGVRVYLALTGLGAGTATLLHPNGVTSWTFTPTVAAGWYETRTAFLGKPAAGFWTLTVSGATTLTEFRLLVSNDVDAGQIYTFRIYRDPAAGGNPDYPEARAQFSRFAMGHMDTLITERVTAIVGDDHTVAGREPVGV